MLMHKKYTLNVLPIASIFSFRMLGLFMLIPVFTIYADELHGATPSLIGLALGVYGLTQGLFQIPLGTLSDKIGRKKVITLGLGLFILGSILAATTNNIYIMILARAIQGMGAIGSTLIALTADLTQDEDRTKAMALIGLTIGVSFAIAMVISPPLAKVFHLKGIFWVMAIMGSVGLFLLHSVVPNPRKEVFHADSEPVPKLFKAVLKNSELLRLDAGIFIQHAILTATFFVIPLLLENRVSHQWLFYLPLLVVSFLIMIPFIIVAEKKRKMKQVFSLSVGLCLVSQLLLTISHASLTAIFILLFIYFIGFNILEASLPSLVSKTSPSGSKGTAMGIYSSSQFLGIFCGGVLAGSLFHLYSYQGVFGFNTLLAFAWFVIAITMKQPNYYSSKILSLPNNKIDKNHIIKTLLKIAGIKEVSIASQEKIIYLKIDKKHYEEGSAEQTILMLQSSSV